MTTKQTHPHDDMLDSAAYATGRASGKSLLGSQELFDFHNPVPEYNDKIEAKIKKEFPDEIPKKIWEFLDDDGKREYAQPFKSMYERLAQFQSQQAMDKLMLDQLKEGTNVKYANEVKAIPPSDGRTIKFKRRTKLN